MASFPLLNNNKRRVAMETEIITIFCICDDLLKQMNYFDDVQVKMSTSEVMTTALVAAKFFGGNYEKSRVFMQEHHYISNMLSKSQFNRRLLAIDQSIWNLLFSILSRIFKQTNKKQEYAVDSFPVPVCDNIRIFRCKIYQDESYRGWTQSKRRYFYGVRIHMVVTATGQPVEFTLEPGARSDIRAFKRFTLNLPAGAKIYADKAYNDYKHEDLVKKETKIQLIPKRKVNSKRPFNGFIGSVRKIVETSFSLITSYFPRKIHAVSRKGFELKLITFIFAYAFSFL